MGTTRYKLLLIDDDLPAIELARSAAAEIYPEVELTVVGGGDAALDWLGGTAANEDRMPDIVLMDLQLPRLEGLAVLRKMRKHPRTDDIPIVSFSAEFTHDDVLMSYQAGANSFVPKPEDIGQFRDFFRERLGYWMQIDQNGIVRTSSDDVAD